MLFRSNVTLSSGRILTADVVIGADGPTSIAREAVLGRKDDAEPEGMSMFGGTVPASEMLKDPVLRRWVVANDVSAFTTFVASRNLRYGLVPLEQWPIFMGPNRSVCCKYTLFL